MIRFHCFERLPINAPRSSRAGAATLFASGYADIALMHKDRLGPAATIVNKLYRRAELLKKVRA
jgi:hypothetical protein